MGMVNAIRDSGKSLLNILNDILDFSKIEAGKLELSSAAMSVETTLDQVCQLLSPVGLDAQVDLSYFVEPTMPATLVGRPAHTPSCNQHFGQCDQVFLRRQGRWESLANR